MISAQVLQGVLDSVNGKIIPPTTGRQAKTISRHGADYYSVQASWT